MKKRGFLSALAALALVFTLSPAVRAEAPAPAVSSNRGGHEYVNGRRWAQPAKSYLYENQSGGLTRVEYIEDHVVVEDYDASFGLQSSRTLPAELPLWGGFFAGEKYNFLIFGQENKEEDDSREVIRVVQYDKSWNRLGQASLKGANTIVPFDAGSLRCDEYGGYLYIRTSHKMYTAKDGLNHQANVMIALRQKDMEITDSFWKVMNVSYGYVSHSFNQFVLIDQEGRIVTLDHGDAGQTRAAVLLRYNAKAGQDSFQEGVKVPLEDGYYTWSYVNRVDVLAFPQAAQHYNDTGCALGGFAETSKGYVTAYQFDGTASNLGADSRDLYLSTVGKDLKGPETVRLTTGQNVSNPQLAPTGLEGGYVLWNTVDQKNWYTAAFGDILYYAAYDANGAVGQVQTAQGQLSDCQPIFWQGKAVWYTTDNSVPTFYLLDGAGVTARKAGTAAAPDPTPVPDTATAHASTQLVLVDGKSVEFQAYALLDEQGNPTNYVKLRDLAYVLNGTGAQFEVDWDGGVVVTTKTPYTVRGGEMTTPYEGNQPCTSVEGDTNVDGKPVRLDAFTIYDSQNNGYTYYKLRDLGSVLGFGVDWTDGQGITISTR